MKNPTESEQLQIAKDALRALREAIEDVLYRFNHLKDAGCLPYPMVYDKSNPVLRAFQRWVIRRIYMVVPWEEYNRAGGPAHKARV